MVRLVLIFVFCLVACFPASSQRGSSGGGQKQANSTGAGFAVVELFTSQGCSSCPSADKLLAEIIRDAKAKGRNIYAMAFHVDYWNKLGWKDPYGKLAFTRRQNNYVSALGGKEVYTPQAFVNGTLSMVGSDRKRLSAAIDTALAYLPAATIEVSRDSIRRDTLFMSYDASGTDPNHSLVAALVERGIRTNVGKGENAGMTLQHENVVRLFRISRLDSAKGVLAFPLQGIVPGKAFSLFAYIQQKQTKRILAATGLAF